MKKKILVIEDNEQNIYLVTVLLENSDFDVVQARDGQEGLKLAVQENPDLILLDIQLPVMDGYKVARLLKQDEITANIPIIAVTSYAMPGDRERVLAAGCEEYIEKPINPDTFINRIQQFLSER